MAVAAAEQITGYPYLVEGGEFESAERPLVIDVASLETEQFCVMAASRFAGKIAVNEMVETAPGSAGYSLYEALQLAASGDKPARNLLTLNVKSDQIERTLKSGHITEVPLEQDEQGRFVQHGQNSDAIQANNIRHGSRRPQMRARSMAETRNKFRLENAARQGWLEDYCWVLFSRAADDMSEADMNDEGFFTETMSMAIQVVTSEGGKFVLESAFVAGKKSPASGRHDAHTVETFYAQNGIDISGMSATETLERPLLIPKSLMPNGVVDVVEQLDDIAGTFFGKAEPRQDYLEYRQFCTEREASFEPRVEAAVNRLLTEAHTIHSPEEASMRLGKISAEEMVEQAVADRSIDSAVFGAEAAFRIEHARHLLERGEFEHAKQITNSAKEVEQSRSCPGGASSKEGSSQQNTESPTQATNSDKPKDCDFVSKKCPVCGEKNAKTRVRNGVYYHVGKSCRG